MKCARIGFIGVLALGSALELSAQFGNILNRAKDKVDRTTSKAKPVSDRTQRAVETYHPWSDTEEQEIGEATAAKMIAMFGLVEEAPLHRYVNLVGQAVAQFAPRQVPYRFAVLDTEIVGAFALPGGFVFITREALQSMGSEAQLAGALGHEVIHVSERHLEGEVRSKRTTSWAVEEAKARSGSFPLRERADALVRDLLNMKLSREKEDSADEEGTGLAAKAGYAPGGLVDFLKTLTEASAKPDQQRKFGQLLSTHPSFQERIEHLAPIVQKSPAGGKTLEARFHSAVPAPSPK